MRGLFARLSLSKKFLLVSFPVLLAATLAIGWWVGEQVKHSVVARTGAVTALYVDTFVSPYAQTLTRQDHLTDQDRSELMRLFVTTALGERIVSLKIWRADGRVVFATQGGDEGRTFAIDAGLRTALEGRIYSEISGRSAAEQSAHGQPRRARVIETYTPIHAEGSGKVIGAAEFYADVSEVDREAANAQRRAWLIVASAMLLLYVLLYLIVRGGSQTIARQQFELEEKLRQLTALNAQNEKLHGRVRRAAERATALNESFLRRVSSDIHDGPGQDLGFASMQLKNLTDDPVLRDAGVQERLSPVRTAVEAALRDLCAITADIQLPELEALSACELVERVVRDFQAKTGTSVKLTNNLAPLAMSMRVKITLYRLLQEALANTYRHANARYPRVSVNSDGGTLLLEVSDDGPGFDTQSALMKGRLGLTGMRERAEVLGGSFEIASRPGQGSRIRIGLPLEAGRSEDD